MGALPLRQPRAGKARKAGSGRRGGPRGAGRLRAPSGKSAMGRGGHRGRIPYSRGWVAVPLPRSVLAPRWCRSVIYGGRQREAREKKNKKTTKRNENRDFRFSLLVFFASRWQPGRSRGEGGGGFSSGSLGRDPVSLAALRSPQRLPPAPTHNENGVRGAFLTETSRGKAEGLAHLPHPSPPRRARSTALRLENTAQARAPSPLPYCGPLGRAVLSCPIPRPTPGGCRGPQQAAPGEVELGREAAPLCDRARNHGAACRAPSCGRLRRDGRRMDGRTERGRDDGCSAPTPSRSAPRSAPTLPRRSPALLRSPGGTGLSPHLLSCCGVSLPLVSPGDSNKLRPGSPPPSSPCAATMSPASSRSSR